MCMCAYLCYTSYVTAILWSGCIYIYVYMCVYFHMCEYVYVYVTLTNLFISYQQDLQAFS